MEIRAATADDTPTLVAFLHAMAAFEELEASVTKEVLRESLFGEQPASFPIAEGGPSTTQYTLSDYREDWYIGAIALVPAVWMAHRFLKKPLLRVAWQLPDVSN
ncbi:MAG: hypothetical protein GY747_13045 [Planctomycetes bacterium]|nr:hypothetical protein [Planctomycetota bacterium]MCP4772013.1 hypothetical protein [Planctomycetota bacterium]MCP4860247.1 hypothetical protein [Planctomycetota bacterium]